MGESRLELASVMSKKTPRRVKVAAGLYVNWDSFIRVDDAVLSWVRNHLRNRVDGLILQTEAEAVYTLSEALREGGREFLISEQLYSLLDNVFKNRERRLGGNGYHMGRALNELGFCPLVSYPLRPAVLMEASPEFRVALGDQFKKPREAIRRGDPEYDHIIFEFKQDLPRGIRVTGRHIFSWDHMSSRGIFDYDFLKYASDPKFTDILVLSYAHLLLSKNKANTDEIIRYLDRSKRPKVNLELGEGSEESIKYALKSYIDHNVLDSLSMNEKECKTYFNAQSTELEELTSVTAEKIKEYGLNRICVHSQDFAFSITKQAARKEFEALRMGRRAASALTMGGIRSFWDKTESMAKTKVKRVEKRMDGYILCVIPVLMNPEPRILTGLGDTFAAVQAVIALS